MIEAAVQQRQAFQQPNREKQMALPLAADYPFMNILWSTLIFVAFIMWFWLVIMIFADIFRRHDMGGFAKALWIIFIIFIPLLGVLVYLIAYNKGIAERSAKAARRRADRRSTRMSRKSPGAAVPRRRSSGRRVCSTRARSRRRSSIRSSRARWPAA